MEPAVPERARIPIMPAMVSSRPSVPEPRRGLRLDPLSGRLAGARQVDSPNQDDRPPGCEPELVVLHGISLPPGEFGGDGIEALFTNRLDPAAHPYYRRIAQLRVSSHFLIRRDGELVQFVPVHRRAWHAGESSYRGRRRCNDFSVGIELEGTDELPYTDPQYEVLDALLAALFAACPRLGPEHVTGHEHVSPGRKTDPGPAFDWARLRRGLAMGTASAETRGHVIPGSPRS